MIDVENQTPSKKKADFERLYVALTEQGVEGFKDKAAFEQACYQTIRLCLSVNDYIHSNNVLQIYKSEVSRERAAWYHYYSLLICGKRLPRYFLEKPERMKRKVERYIRDNDPKKLHTALINMLLFYAKLYQNYGERFKKNLLNFTSFYKEHSLEPFEAFHKGIEELDAFVKGDIEYEDLRFDRIAKASEFEAEAPEPHKTQVSEKDTESQTQEARVYAKDPKVLILGALSVGKDKVYGIAKKVGFKKDQIEVENDYAKITNLDISHLRHTDQYCGIVFGPVPHSSKSSAGDSSIITHVENTEGYPYHVKATANDKLKLTKTSLTQALEDVYNNYTVTKL